MVMAERNAFLVLVLENALEISQSQEEEIQCQFIWPAQELYPLTDHL